MLKKNRENNQNQEDAYDPTKPLRTGRKVYRENNQGENTTPVVEPTVEESNVAEEPRTAPKKVRRAKWIWLGILIMLVITALGAGTGYVYAMQIRLTEENNQKLTAATTQFLLAEKDQQNGQLEMARQRLEYVLKVYPDYPGVTDKLKEVIVAISLNQAQVADPQETPATVITPVVTVDTGQVKVLLSQAQNQLSASDWRGLLDTVEKMRNIDPTYEAIKVDSLYYFALRYNAIDKIKTGHLEKGLYYFSMAEQIAPLDADTYSWINWARMYQFAGSYFGYNPARAVEEFQKVAKDIPNLIDTSGLTAKDRYIMSLEDYGDALMLIYDYCNAAIQYEASRSLLSSETINAKLNEAQAFCAAPPPLPTEDPNAPGATPVQ